MHCSVVECGRSLAAKGLCDTHYRRVRRYGSLDAPPRPKRGKCSIEDCGRAHYAKGLCQRHWQSVRLHGDPLAVGDRSGPKRRADELCDVDDCTRAYRSRGYCHMHYTRWRIHGDPTVVVDPNAHIPWRTVGDYRILRRLGHPLARAQGLVLEHRMVLFDAIGPGQHPCRWCQTLVTWESWWPKSADALVVDHLDRNRSNNAVENLAPSCQGCNARRANQWRALPQASITLGS